MLINGIDISSLGVKLYDRVLNSNSIYTADDWLDGDIQPTNVRQQAKFRYIKLSFLVLGVDEQDAFYRISRLTKELSHATIKFDDINVSFEVSVRGAADTQRLKNGNFIVSYNLHSDCAKGSREIYTTNANLTNAFKLNLLYYQNTTQLLSSESVTIRASSFNGGTDTLESLGINIDKYKPDYYNHGVATNINGLELTYANLQYLGTLIINYAPTPYNLTLNYMMDDGTGYFNDILQETIQFTYPQLQELQTIGQLVQPQRYKPEGYKSAITFSGDLTVENILAQSPMAVLYEKIENARSKNIVVGYQSEDDNGEWQNITSQIVNVTETQFYDGFALKDLFNVNGHRPDVTHYNEGYIVNHSNTELITYEDVDLSYTVRYPRTENIVFLEYYVGVYPGWNRITTTSILCKYKDSYSNDFSLDLLGIDLNRYHTENYETGRIYNTGALNTYDNVINAGVIQVYYKPIDYTIVVNFYTEGNATPNTQSFTINALDFLQEPVLADIIPISQYKPSGYQLDLAQSYSGDVTLAALTQASPITIVFEEIEVEQTKNILIHYKQEFANAFGAINTVLITVNESDCVGGVRLRDIINLDLYRPSYYQRGQLDGYSEYALLQFSDIRSEYDVIYYASQYGISVEYYTDDVDPNNWIGSDYLYFRVIDFETTTTLFDLGLNVNLLKPSYCDDGVVQYHGAVNFQALYDLVDNNMGINIVYDTIDEPTEDDGIDYPHRFLFLQHNDLGDYEGLHPEWTLNHAYINTGVTAADMSKLTVIMECKRVDENVPLHDVNGAYGYLFGSSSAQGSFYMRFNNQTQYHSGSLTGVNTYEAKAGYYTNQLTVTEENAIGWSENAGIYASARDGYSNATFTYTSPVQSENARMPYPLFLFANNNAGLYEYGLAGMGIFGCRIYYDNVLIRDFIPVKTYDKIGNQVAPSNCLYDKVTKTFFEDATGLNSFNIIDDDRYIDTNPDHQIGFCYVNYRTVSNAIFTTFKTAMYYFRASDFIGKQYDPYTEWRIDENQPAYYEEGEIQNYNYITKNFNGLNGQTFYVNYREAVNVLQAIYYKDDGVNPRQELGRTTKTLHESDFYQNPSFGDLIRLNKYKPDGYRTDFIYPEPKVTLGRVMRHSPYEIVYVPETDPLQDYTTTIRYIKKVYGIRTYETIGEITLHFDQTDFRDGEYIDFYIDKNAYKPTKFYKDGEFYQWYEMDERLDAPEKLREYYTVVYDCDVVYLPVNYYTDDWDEANLIASTTWAIKLDEFDPEYPFYIVDQLPNTYINKYRPANCAGGVIQNSETSYSFIDLAELEEIAIVYDSIAEPHDPTEDYYERKILYWGDLCNRIYPSYNEILQGIAQNTVIEPWRVPYIDLGYRPKEIGRLRVEWTGASKPIGVQSPISPYSYYADDFTTIFGYCGAPSFNINVGTRATQVIPYPAIAADQYVVNQGTETFSRGSKGYFGIKARVPSTEGAMWIYSYNGPSSIDGAKYTDNVLAGRNVTEFVYYRKPGITAGFRRGFRYDVDDNYNTIDVFKDYQFKKNFVISEVLEEDRETDGFMQVNGARFQAVGLNSYDDTIPREQQDGTWYGNYSFANPFTVVLDAYNNYCSIWNYHDSNYPFTWKFENTDNPIWEDIERPRGSLSLFTSTNPTTGQPNYLDDIYYNFPFLGGISGAFSLAFGASAVGVNPYVVRDDDLEYGTMTYEVEVVMNGEVANGGIPVVTTQTQTRNVLFADWQTPSFPWQAGGILWSLKIYDQDRLVRDLIPVAQGDEIYDRVMPADGLFDLVTEIFFGDSNPGQITTHKGETITYEPARLYAIPDILSYGKITTNYYDYDNSFIDNKFVDVPTWFYGRNTTIEEILEWNDYKPDDYHLDGWIDVDQDWSWWGNKMNLRQIYEMGAINIFYRLRTFTKTVVYYRDNVRVGSRDIMYSLDDIRRVHSLSGLGIDVDLYYDPKFKHGRVVYNEQIIADDNIEAFINAPSPIVVSDEFSQQEAPDIFYVEYYRGGAYDNNLITLDPNDTNYLNCNMQARVLNPSGAIMYLNHYHQALYEDENFGEFIPYQVRVLNKYTGLHYGPGRKYKTLAMIIIQDTYTIIQERNGWGRLREYPNAWILLSATEPITGPGQNPAYDIADSTVTTIPFGEWITVTKMTIDRLWCYVATVDSWVKAEDISFNQAGKLYNGLHIDAIDLTTLDYSNINEFADFIELNQYKMRFHENAQLYYNHSYVSAFGYTQSALRSTHELDIVYPETIYTYSCRYYKENVAQGNYLGASGFSCSISDWNPDWDTFIETSWQYVEDEGEGTVYGDNTYRRNIYRSMDSNSELLGQMVGGTTVYLLSAETEGGTQTWYKVRYNDLIGYTISSNVTHITKTYGGRLEVSPTLYRDTVMTLTWDYFGFERNLYRPTGYSDGIYLWNPRSWDKDNRKFSFDELIKCGTQYVIYPSFNPNTYKIWVEKNYLGLYGIRNGTMFGLFNPGILIDCSVDGPVSGTGLLKSDYLYTNEHYSVYQSAEWRNDLGTVNNINTPNSETVRNGTNLVSVTFGTPLNHQFSSLSMPFSMRLERTASSTTPQNQAPEPLVNIKNGDLLIVDYSNYRYSPTGVIGIGNSYENREPVYYVYGNSSTALNDSMNIKNYHKNPPVDITKTSFTVDEAQTIRESQISKRFVCGVIHDIISYYDFMMIHYYVAVPRGMPYKYGGQDLRMPADGLFDLLTGEFKRNVTASLDRNNSDVFDTTFYTQGTMVDGMGSVFYRDQPIARSQAFSWFDNWNYSTSNVLNMYKETNTTVPTYQHPDESSIKIRNLTSGVVLPISKSTSDSAHGISGTWYKSCDQWFKSDAGLDNVTGYSNYITANETTICLVPGTSNFNSFYVYNDPDTIVAHNQSSNYSYGNQSSVIKVYYEYNKSGVVSSVFDGSHWIPKYYTNLATTTMEKNYAITQTTPFYSLPIADNEYKLGNYLYGARVYVPYVCQNDNNWAYTGEGWIQLEGNTSEVI